MKTPTRRARGFTLLELIVVIAILATIGGGLLVAYDGLDTKAAQGQATYNIAGLDKSIRTFATVNGAHPNDYDALLFSAAGTGADGVALDIMAGNFVEKFGPHTLTAEGVAALNAAGITNVRYVSGTLGSPTYPNDNSAEPSIPNRVFDNQPRGFGVSIALTAGSIVPAVESAGATSTLVTAFDSSTSTSRVQDMAGLIAGQGHVVVVLGIGNNATLVVGDGGGAGLSEAPIYTNLPKNKYARFYAMYHIATDADDNGTLATTEYLSKARFVGVLDSKGDWYDEEYAEFTGQKN